MNLVRLGLITGLCGVAWYALSIYAQIPTPEPRILATTCTYANGANGAGMVIVALAAIGSALGVAITDLIRRVY